VADQHRSDGGPDEGGKRRPGSARAKPATKSPTSGPTASRDIAPLWVDDGPPEPTVDRDESGKDG
jgi:hypothetical protein